ncbi:arylsulfatase H-like [Penaeus japonicus]|uniref:arylsulfatase H-like n=1 Tax=Penaeus japonicus TaxID=27405 RepID=UPI001C70C9B3|nr:arylsulfatase H-like [Penaeus japonicus]
MKTFILYFCIICKWQSSCNALKENFKIRETQHQFAARTPYCRQITLRLSPMAPHGSSRKWIVLATALVVAGLATGEGTVEGQKRRPNVVILVADDLGIGDLGCYGNTTIKTPNIDRLSEEGVRLTHHLAAASMCTPSRAALLTGRYPARYGLVGEEGTAPVVVHVASRVGLPPEEVTFAKALSAANYTTAAVGKWHLGMRCKLGGFGCRGPQEHGFQSFYGLPFTLAAELEGPHDFWLFPQGERFYKILARLCLVGVLTILVWGWLVKCSQETQNTLFAVLALGLGVAWFVHTHYRFHTEKWWQVSPWMDQHLNGILMENTKVVEQPVTLPGLSQRLVDYSLDFISDHAHDENPFLLYHSFAHVHTPMFTAKHMEGKSEHGRYGDNVEEMDAGVGAILEALRLHEIDDNTLVYFLSDHGGHLEAIDKGQRTGGHNGLFKGGKGMGGAEGGIRVPGIFRWKGHLPAGKTIDTPTSLLDTLPTLLDLVDLPPVNSLLPDLPERDLDGVSLAGLLKEGVDLKPRSLIHHCRQAIHALRLVVEKRVYKMYLAKHKWSPGSTQCGWGSNNLCSCYGDGVEDITFEPEVYDLTNDPYEDNPISNETTEYTHVVGALRQFLAEWKARVPYPPSQFSNKADTVLSPWLQPFRIPFL